MAVINQLNLRMSNVNDSHKEADPLFAKTNGYIDVGDGC